MARSKQRARKAQGAVAAHNASDKVDGGPSGQSNGLSKKAAGKEQYKQDKLRFKAKMAAKKAKRLAKEQSGQQSGEKNSNQPPGLTQKQRKAKVREEREAQKKAVNDAMAREGDDSESRPARRRVSLAEQAARDAYEPSDSEAGKNVTMKGSGEGDDEFQPDETEEITKRVTRSQTFTLPQRPAKGAAKVAEKAGKQAPGAHVPMQIQQAPLAETAQKSAQPEQSASTTDQPPKRTPEEQKLRKEKMDRRVAKRKAKLEKKEALKAAQKTQKRLEADRRIANKTAKAPDLDAENDNKMAEVEDVALALPPGAAELLAEEERRLAQVQADRVRGKARLEARKAFDVAESVRYQELAAKGAVLATAELMAGRSTFPLDFWEDLAGTKMAAMSRGVGMYL